MKGCENAIIVEGDDDIHILIRFVENCGLKKVPDSERVERYASCRIIEGLGIVTRVAYVTGGPQTQAASTGKDAAIGRLQDEMKSGNRRGIAIVVDADDNPTGTWESICHAAGIGKTEKLPKEGYVGRVGEMGIILGCWIMPDNASKGALEDFLLSLAQGEKGIEHARGVVRSLPEGVRPNNPPPTFESKSTLHTWLAWQELPGPRPSVAITRKLLSFEREAAKDFIAWLNLWLGEIEKGVQE